MTVVLAGCAVSPTAPKDGMPPDEDTSDLCAPQPGVFTRAQCNKINGVDVCNEMCTQIGSACTAGETPFCAGGFGWCTAGVCRAFCGETACPDGTHRESVTGSDGRAVCVCSPG